ncbi:MAG: hypothetical protein ABSA30_02035 [Candidatus Aminicenantales bacterium]|jgi:hypothetical protein
MKKVFLAVLVVLAMASLTWAQAPDNRFELNLFGGYALTSVKGAATYADSWSFGYLTNVDESAAIASTSKNAPFFGGGLNFFFTPNFGLGINIGYMKSTLNTTSDINFNWTWFSISSYSKTASLASDSNSLTSIPLSLNLIGRFGNGPIQGFIEGGPTIYFNEAIVNSAIGYGVSEFIGLTQYVDAIELPISGYDKSSSQDGLSGKTTWIGFGANIGGGIAFMFSPSLGLSLEARYFFCPEREFDWNIATGSYNGMFFGDITGWTIAPSDVNYIKSNNLLTTIKINPSFFAVQAGLKIRL